MRFKKNLFQIVFVLISVLIGFISFYYFYHEEKGMIYPLIGGGLGGVLGILIIIIEKKIRKLPLLQIVGGTVGLLIGLGLAVLISNFFEVFTNDVWQIFLYAMSLLCFGYLGLVLGGKKFEEIKFQDFLEKIHTLLSQSITSVSKKFTKKEQMKVLDTSAIIDGRIVDIYKTGWLEGNIVVPDFILEEIQILSDNTDPTKRERGKRALDLLNKLKEIAKNNFKIMECDYRNIPTDEKLIKFCKKMEAKLITTDHNLQKVCKLQGIEVLNINELFLSLRPKIHPGDTFKVTIVKPGKEKHQGVGYLEDGTMVVIENARALIGKEVEIVVTHIIHSSSGRIIFSQIKNKQNS